MSAPLHIAIIGAGIIGLSTAYALLERRNDLKLTLIEAGDKAGHGASWANGSMIHPSQAWPWPESYSDESYSAESGNSESDHEARAQIIAIESYKMARRSSQILRAHFDTFDLALRHRKSGTVKLYDSQAGLEAGLKRLNILAEHGLTYELWTPAELAQQLGLPAGPERLHKAVHFAQDHSGPARLYCAALIKAIQERGGEIILGARARALLESKPDGDKINLENGESISADQIIICAGAGGAQLLPELAITGLRGYSRTFSRAGLAAHIPPIPIMDDQAHISLTPLGDHFRISGGADLGAEDLSEELNEKPDIYDYFSDYAAQHFPHLRAVLAECKISDWTALRPMRRGGPLIGHVRGNIWANIGHGHMGWTLCAGASAQLADQMIG